ncbi:MAG: hypothetical protein ACXVCY_00750 [Pseudobdellovibrionaceae bacterium]
MREQILVGMLALALALGFILSIEALARGRQPVNSQKFLKFNQSCQKSLDSTKTKICAADYN